MCNLTTYVGLKSKTTKNKSQWLDDEITMEMEEIKSFSQSRWVRHLCSLPLWQPAFKYFIVIALLFVQYSKVHKHFRDCSYVYPLSFQEK